MKVSAGVVFVSVVALAGCSPPSVEERTNDACSDVRKAAATRPRLGPDDGGTRFIPAIDKQLAAARKAQRDFTDAKAAPDFTAAWNKMVGALREDRTAWRNVTPWQGAPGTEMVGVLGLSAAKADVDEAKKSMNTAASRHGYTTCETIEWQY